MKSLFDTISNQSAVNITKNYSTSFSIAVSLLAPSIRQAIYNIYGFVRVADEIVDSFENYPQEEILNRFEEEYDVSEIDRDGIFEVTSDIRERLFDIRKKSVFKKYQI